MMSLLALFNESRRTPARPARRSARPEPFPAADAALEISSALVFGFQALDREMGLAAHAERVAALADRMAAAEGVSAPLRSVLRQAALLHEVGMIAVPRELLHRADPLSEAEMERVHAQAELGAAIARATCGGLAATIIRHQYDGEAALRDRLGEGTDAYRLTMLLRAADLADTVSLARLTGGSAGARLVLREGTGPYPDPATAEAWVEATAA